MNVALLVLLVFAAIILINVWIHKSIVSRALNNYIIPDLINKKLAFSKSKWTGFFQQGDFNKEFTFGPFLETGNPFINVFLFIYYLENGQEKRVTAKVETSFLSIRRVTYNREP